MALTEPQAKALAALAILDPAQVPSKPFGPNRFLYSLIAFLGGIFTGIGLAVVVEMTDPSVRDEREAAAILGKSVIAGIPLIVTDSQASLKRMRVAATMVITVICSSGIGLLTAIELANNGFKVIASMRDLGRRDRLDQAASAAGVSDKLDVQRLDVSESAAMPALAEKLVRDYGRLDVLVNNAGFAVAGFAEDVKLDELRQQFETNFFGHVALTKAVLPVMRQQRSGHIIMVSSISGLHGALSVST